MSTPQIAIVGTVGVPGNYGGFETLADNLVRYHSITCREEALTVYCSAKASFVRPDTYYTARLRYIRLEANGPQSILYDALSLFDAVWRGNNHLLVLGTSGALVLPLVRLVSRARVITNIDGIEWKRQKWKGLAKVFLRASEWAAVRFSHCVIADNQAIADYVAKTYRHRCEVIPYGGDQALDAEPEPSAVAGLPNNYALALCRIEPENNVSMILEAFADLDMPLVFVGNWGNSEYSRNLRAEYKDHPTITIRDPVYEPRSLRAIRDRASIYVHGHSAGGTNPSLVEMMHFSIPILAHRCSFNRHTMEEKGLYFTSASELADTIRTLTPQTAEQIGADMGEIARRRYTWDQIGEAYFKLLEG